MLAMEGFSPEAMRHGIKRVKLSSSNSIFTCVDSDECELTHSKSRPKNTWECIDDPLDDSMAAALQKDLDEHNEDVDDDEWVDDDLGVFGEAAIENPYKELQVQDIHGRGLPNASYVKAAECVVVCQEQSELATENF